MNECELLRKEFLGDAENPEISLFPYNIVLIGFMGAGKSTIAGMMHEAFSMEVIEMDQVIADQQGMSIPEIFENTGKSISGIWRRIF